MKQFILKIDEEHQYMVEGESLEKIKGWEKGIPGIWKKNSDKIVEVDITKKIAETKAKRQRKKDLMDFLEKNFSVLAKMVDEYGNK